MRKPEPEPTITLVFHHDVTFGQRYHKGQVAEVSPLVALALVQCGIATRADGLPDSEWIPEPEALALDSGKVGLPTLLGD
jgi:hypothetical protein